MKIISWSTDISINSESVTRAGNSNSNRNMINNHVKNHHKDRKSDSGCYIENDSRWSIVHCFANEYLRGVRRHSRTSLWKRWRWKRISAIGKALFFFYVITISANVVATQGTDSLQSTNRIGASSPKEEAVIVSSGEVCSSVDVRNTPLHLERLRKCRVVEGFVQIMLIDKYGNDSFDNYTFPLLTEITGYLLLFRVNGLQTLGQLFPNLTVIRGSELANNYALVVYELMHIKELGLTSLIDIQRGGVRIEKNPNLCHADTIDWKTIAPEGENWIKANQDANECTTCPSNVTVLLPNGMTQMIRCPSREVNRLIHNDKPSHLCWSSNHCQQKCPTSCPKSCTKTGECCNTSCLGQCSSGNKSQCMVCRNYYYIQNNHTRCVDKCPDHMFLFSESRCLTEEECYKLYKPLQRVADITDDHPYVPAQGECRLDCPVGYTLTPAPGTQRLTCVPCKGPCRSECKGMVIESISQIQQLRGCTIIQGSLSIRLRQLGGENVVRELEKVLYSIEEIYGYLTIVRSYALMSLGFFRNLKIIHGTVLNANLSLSVIDNQNLQELWNQNVTIKRGNVRFNDNPMLCVKKITSLKSHFGDGVGIENEEQLNKTNGVRVACEIKKLRTKPTKISLDSVIIQWDSFKDLPDMRQLLGYVVYYIEAPHENVTFYDGRDACNSQGWRVDDVANMQELDQATHILTRLQPFTQYAYYVKTYTLSSENLGGQTDITYFRTSPGTPRIIRDLHVYIENNTLVVSWQEPTKIYGKLSAYKIGATLNDERNDMIKQRNYCHDEIEKPETKPNIPVESTSIATTASPVKDNQNQCSKEECAAFCSASGVTESESGLKIDVNEVEMSIGFEDWLHNYVYIKNPKSSRKRREDSGSSATVPAGNNSYIFPSNTENKPRIASNYESMKDPNEEYYRTLGETTNQTRITFPLSYFKHFALYTFRVHACREQATKVPGVVVQDMADLCGSEVLFIYRTPTKPDADDIPLDSIELDDQSNHTQRVIRVRWKGPSKPNGALVSYSIKYHRTDLDSVQPTVRCVTVDVHTSLGYALLTKLDAGNYSIRIMATTTAGNGPYSPPKFLSLEKRESDTLTVGWLITIGAVAVVLVSLLTIGVCYIMNKYKQMSNMRLFAQVNPDYAGVTYKVDEWEVPREHIIQLEELGQGSFGMVYKGIMTKLGNDTNVPCAIKTVTENATERERDSFLIEATIMKEFHTHHVVRLYGVVSVGQPTLVIMELMANGDLKSYLRRHRPDYENGEESSPQPPTLKQIYQMAIEIADGMAYLSAKKFVHRDLAARNCMVAEDLTVKIGDFGMTRDIYETDYYRKGTKGFLPVRWMAPESLKDGMFSSSSDVFSYGVVLWEMATLASQPYQGLTNDQVLRYVIDGGVMERPENCPDKLYELMRICWQHRATARPSFVDIIRMLLPDANDHFKMVSFFFSPDAIDNSVQPGQALLDDVTEPLRAHEDGFDEDEDDPYSIEGTDSRLMQNNGPKPDIRSPHSPQRFFFKHHNCGMDEIIIYNSLRMFRDYHYVSNIINAGNSETPMVLTDAPNMDETYNFINKSLSRQSKYQIPKSSSNNYEVPQINSSAFYTTHIEEYSKDTAYSYDNCATFEGNTSYLNVSCETILNYSIPLYGYCIPFVLLITLAANSLIIVILKKRTMASPTNVILMAMALCDMFTLLFPAPGLIYMYTFGNHYKPLAPIIACYVWNALNEILPAMCHTASVWLTLALAVQRYIYVCHAPAARTWCTISRVKKCIGCIFFAALLHQSCRFFDRSYTLITIEWGGQLTNVCHVETAKWIHEYTSEDLYYTSYFTFRILFVHLIPCASLVTLNILLFRAMKQAQQKRERLFQDNKKRESKRVRDSNCTTLMLIVVVTVFLVVEIPLGVITALHIISSLLYEFLDYYIANLFILFANFFLIVSYPINFAIYCGMSRQFRETFKEIFLKSKSLIQIKNEYSSSKYTSVNGPRTFTNETVI
ncbi:insulin-like receptor isoform X5 [Anopheles stephensi]|uniref:insulin-like receptor isoform X5 n=1 Tax=Anopheles stephensi TaxID=30069 RepID=UPI0016588979|nr:insulin-like receptor isoform X5 [Anopheles stephensi]